MAWVSNPSRNITSPQSTTMPYWTAPMGRELIKAGTSNASSVLLTVFFLEFFAVVSWGERFNQGPPDRFPRPRRDLRRSRHRRDQPSSGNRVVHGRS